MIFALIVELGQLNFINATVVKTQTWATIGWWFISVLASSILVLFGQTSEHPCCLQSILCQSLLLATREQSKLNWIESHSLPSFKYETKSIPSLAVLILLSVNDIAAGDLSEIRRSVYVKKTKSAVFPALHHQWIVYGWKYH